MFIQVIMRASNNRYGTYVSCEAANPELQADLLLAV